MHDEKENGCHKVPYGIEVSSTETALVANSTARKIFSPGRAKCLLAFAYQMSCDNLFGDEGKKKGKNVPSTVPETW